LRELPATFIHTLMGAEADALCGVGYGERAWNASIAATGIGTAKSTLAQVVLIWRSRSCGTARTSWIGAGTPQAR